MEIEKPDTWSPLDGSACPFEGQLTAQEGPFFLDKGHLKVCTAIQTTQVTGSNCNGRPLLTNTNWAVSIEFGTYRLCEQ